jgi:L-fucose isomerase-like protein
MMPVPAPVTDPVRFEFTVVASRLHDASAVGELTAPVRSLAASLGGRDTAGAADDGTDVPHVFLVATGGTEQALLDEVARRRVSHPDEPIVLVAHRAHNSLPASLETLAALQQAGGRGRIVYLSGYDDGDEPDHRRLDEAVTDLEAARRMRATRLGLVGGPSAWLVASSPDADVVRRRWGPTVEVIDPARMIELTRVPVAPAWSLADRFTAVADPVRTTVASAEVHAAAAVGSALSDVLETNDLDAVAVRCFDLLGDPGTSGCLALAMLNDDGIVAGCEGDVPSTLAMLWARHLLGQTSWMANPAHVDTSTNQIVLAHCTVAPSLTEGFSLSTHFESGRGVGISGRFAMQPVTLVRLGGVDLDERWIVEGQIVATGHDPGLCRTQVTVELSGGRVDDLLERPLGNHLVLIAGHHARRLERWWQLVVADRD